MRKFYLTYQDRAFQIAQTPNAKFLADEKSQIPSGKSVTTSKHDALVEITLPKDANIHAREYQLYLPDKELLRKKLTGWGEEVGE